jgi:hypothetical protein
MQRFEPYMFYTFTFCVACMMFMNIMSLFPLTYQEVNQGHPDEEGQPADEEAAHDEAQADRRLRLLRPRATTPLRSSCACAKN